MYYLLIVTPVFYDFFNYKTDDAEFHALLPELVKVYLFYVKILMDLWPKFELFLLI